MREFAGKHGLIVGVANKRSISWAIAKAVAGRGARLAVTYQGERLEENVRELSADLADPLILPLDVTSDEQIADVAAQCDEAFGGLDFVVHGAAFAPREELTRPFLETSREGFRIALDVSAYSLVALARAHGAADGEEGRRQPADADLSRRRPRVPELQRDGRRQGGARVVRALPGGGTRAEERFASMRSRPGRSRRWRPPASAASRASCRSIATRRRCGATPRPTRSPTPRRSCSGRRAVASPGRSCIVDGGYSIIGLSCNLTDSGSARRSAQAPERADRRRDVQQPHQQHVDTPPAARRRPRIATRSADVGRRRASSAASPTAKNTVQFDQHPVAERVPCDTKYQLLTR